MQGARSRRLAATDARRQPMPERSGGIGDYSPSSRGVEVTERDGTACEEMESGLLVNIGNMRRLEWRVVTL